MAISGHPAEAAVERVSPRRSAARAPVVARMTKLVPGGVDFSVECSGVGAHRHH
jgi:hypothetical protein